MAQAIFGSAAEIGIGLIIFFILGITTFTVILEYITKYAEVTLHDTPYLPMLGKVYKEMMIMGFLSFGVFMAEVGGIGHNKFLLAFEFAHILIFSTALFFVVQALLTMVMTAKIKNIYNQSMSSPVDYLLAHYSILQRTKRKYTPRWFHDIWEMESKMEFKILRAYFRELYELPYDFDFAGYMSVCLDHHILEIVEVEATTWMFLILLALVLLGVSRLPGTQLGVEDSSYPGDSSFSHHSSESSSSSHYTDSDHRRLGSSEAVLYEDRPTGIYTFMVLGWLLLLWTVIFFFFTWRSERALMRKADCRGPQDFTHILEKVTQEEEEHQLAVQKDHERAQKLEAKRKATLFAKHLSHSTVGTELESLKTKELQTLAELKASAEKLISSVQNEKIKRKYSKQKRKKRSSLAMGFNSGFATPKPPPLLNDPNVTSSNTSLAGTFAGFSKSVRGLLSQSGSAISASPFSSNNSGFDAFSPSKPASPNSSSQKISLHALSDSHLTDITEGSETRKLPSGIRKEKRKSDPGKNVLDAIAQVKHEADGKAAEGCSSPDGDIPWCQPQKKASKSKKEREKRQSSIDDSKKKDHKQAQQGMLTQGRRALDDSSSHGFGIDWSRDGHLDISTVSMDVENGLPYKGSFVDHRTSDQDNLLKNKELVPLNATGKISVNKQNLKPKTEGVASTDEDQMANQHQPLVHSALSFNSVQSDVTVDSVSSLESNENGSQRRRQRSKSSFDSGFQRSGRSQHSLSHDKSISSKNRKRGVTALDLTALKQLQKGIQQLGQQIQQERSMSRDGNEQDALSSSEEFQQSLYRRNSTIYHNHALSMKIAEHPEIAVEGLHSNRIKRLFHPVSSRILSSRASRNGTSRNGSLSRSKVSSFSERRSQRNSQRYKIKESMEEVGSGSGMETLPIPVVKGVVGAPTKTIPSSKFSSDLSDIYVFGSPHLFHKTLEVLLLLNCLYLSLYTSNFLMVSMEMEQMVILTIFLVIPEVVILPVLGLAIKKASLLQAIAEMKPDIITKVIEHTLDVRKLIEEIRETILAEIKKLNLTNKKSGITTIFANMDHDGDGEITYDEFKLALHNFDLHISYERLVRLFRHLDKANSGAISFHEFSRMIDPEESKRQDAVALTLKVTTRLGNKRQKNKNQSKIKKINPSSSFASFGDDLKFDDGNLGAR